MDHTSEERLGNEKVGTTLRGIGPAYEDKAGRRGIRTADALVPDVLRSRIERNLEDANRIIEAYGGEPLSADEIFDEMSVLTERLGPFIADTRTISTSPPPKDDRFFSKARRQRCSTSTTALIRSLLRQQQLLVARSSAPDSRRIG